MQGARAAGYTPVAYDNLGRGHRELVRWGPLEVGDLADRARLDEVFARHRPEAVMHFAAFAYVGESVQRPGAATTATTSAARSSSLEAMRRAGVKALVFSSTCATYGVPERMPIDEDAPQRPINPYGATKLVIERMLARLRRRPTGCARRPALLQRRRLRPGRRDRRGLHDPRRTSSRSC